MSSSSSVTIPPPKALESPIDVPLKTMMGPGPSNAADRVLAATALPVIGHLHPEYCKVMDDVKAGVQYAFQVGDIALVLIIGLTDHRPLSDVENFGLLHAWVNFVLVFALSACQN